MKPKQLLQDLISGEITPAEFKRRAFQPSANASPETLRAAYPVTVTADGCLFDTGESMAEWLPRLKRERGTLRVNYLGLNWEEWQQWLQDEEDNDPFDGLQAIADEKGMTMPQLWEWIRDEELKKSILY